MGGLLGSISALPAFASLTVRDRSPLMVPRLMVPQADSAHTMAALTV
jgi:hypothetical protein